MSEINNHPMHNHFIPLTIIPLQITTKKKFIICHKLITDTYYNKLHKIYRTILTTSTHPFK
jgi:hypothetical protein